MQLCYTELDCVCLFAVAGGLVGWQKRLAGGAACGWTAAAPRAALAQLWEADPSHSAYRLV